MLGLFYLKYVATDNVLAKLDVYVLATLSILSKQSIDD